MASHKIHIGTSGWSYRDWRELFYPRGMKPTDYLSFYAEEFGCTEINTSFYHLPRETTVKGWAEKVPRSFRFCPKISRYLTHTKRLHEPEEALQRFFEIFDPIQPMLGPVLVQLPPSLKFDAGRTEHFYSLLREKYGEYGFALEIRHKTWLEGQSIALMEQYHIAFVISQSDGRFPYAELLTAKDVYVRFHGPGKLYDSLYDDATMQDYAKKFKRWIRDGHVVWAFFNNDNHGYALQNARSLLEFTEGA